MAVICSFGQPDFVRWLMSDGFVRQSKRALSKHAVRYTFQGIMYQNVLYIYLNVLTVSSNLYSTVYCTTCTGMCVFT